MTDLRDKRTTPEGQKGVSFLKEARGLLRRVQNPHKLLHGEGTQWAPEVTVRGTAPVSFLLLRQQNGLSPWYLAVFVSSQALFSRAEP
jgi:hypothetical protein